MSLSSNNNSSRGIKLKRLHKWDKGEMVSGELDSWGGLWYCPLQFLKSGKFTDLKEFIVFVRLLASSAKGTHAVLKNGKRLTVENW